MAHSNLGESQLLDPIAIDVLYRFTTRFWWMAILLYGVGDLATTGIGLWSGGAAEVGPLAGPMVEQFGLLVLLPLKALAIGICLVMWKLTPAPQSVFVPLGLTCLGVVVTSWNTGVLIVAFFLG